MTSIVPDRFDSGDNLKLSLIRHWSQLRENLFRVIRCVEGFLRRYTRAETFAVLSLGIGNLQSRRIAQDETRHVERRRSSKDRSSVSHLREQRQSARMIQMSVGK